MDWPPNIPTCSHVLGSRHSSPRHSKGMFLATSPRHSKGTLITRQHPQHCPGLSPSCTIPRSTQATSAPNDGPHKTPPGYNNCHLMYPWRVDLKNFTNIQTVLQRTKQAIGGETSRNPKQAARSDVSGASTTGRAKTASFVNFWTRGQPSDTTANLCIKSTVYGFFTAA